MVILIRYNSKDDGRYYPQAFLEKALCDEENAKFFVNLINAFSYYLDCNKTTNALFLKNVCINYKCFIMIELIFLKVLI